MRRLGDLNECMHSQTVQIEVIFLIESGTFGICRVHLAMVIGPTPKTDVEVLLSIQYETGYRPN